MLSHFPQIRDEESTYSIFSRLQFAMQPLRLKIMGTVLFNRSYEVGRFNFQCSFDYLCNNLPPKFTSESFLYNNTIYPLFLAFITTEKQEKSLEYFKGTYPDKINKCLVVNNITKKRTYIRVCKECIKEDFKIYGEPYFRRQHEIELNRMCYKHKSPLYEYAMYISYIPKKYEDYCTVLSNSKKINIPEKSKKFFLDIADDINTIFTLNLNNWNIKTTRNKIFNKMVEKGYITITNVLQKNFCQDFKRYYSEEFLNCIGYNFEINDKGSWLRRVTRKNSSSDPLRYILIIRYLFGSFNEFYKYNKEYTTFKKGPYPCLNRICPNYNKLVIKDIMQLNISNGNPVATFKCGYCGFKYSRRGPDKNDNDIYNKTYVKDHGHLWHNKLKECVDNGLNLEKMYKILGPCYLTEIRILVNKYKNPNSVKTTTLELSNNSNILLSEQYRNQVIDFIKETPNATRLNIHRANKIAYNYLFKNDSEWLSNNIKFVKKNKSISKEERNKNLWLDKDDLLENELLIAISKIKLEETPYKRLTVYNLQNHVGYYSFNYNRNTLPKCSQILDKVCETILAYQKRRVNYIMKEMANNNVKITLVQVLRNANLRTRTGANVNEEVLKYVKKMVKEHNDGNIIIEDTDD
ncbi:TnsD family transposase [Clostridium estertheticum]|uniref:TnsD family Tn7-like transposition protein n=1 Tax=Clostridium estertheticum TaxID=238834 RepID=UPI001C0B70C6|nr:TnsD family Tn7-like transposition protein [Clostridium estertheticum]MBU3199499.1 TnsD family transposase [Clostridium estertheticum]WAG65423.1 TnsD family transposase [Clostridium estertheticum]